MAIMVGGGLTFAIPGMEPAHAAMISSNPNLKVSAEGQNADNEITSTNIVEVVIIDDLTDSDAKKPIVRVDGEILAMYFFNNGWYGYFADDDIADSGVAVITDDVTTIQEAVNLLVSANPGRTDTVGNDDTITIAGELGDPDTTPARPNVALLDLDGDFDVVYERAGGDQTVSMELDDPDSGASLDRNNYPQNTDVVITIDDMALNVDPTGTDTWTFGTDGNKQFYGTASGLQVLVDAAKERQERINNAWEYYNGNITAAEFDRDEAEQALDAATRLADAVIDNPIADPNDKKRLIVEYGQGDRDAGTTGVEGFDNEVSLTNAVDETPRTLVTFENFVDYTSVGVSASVYDDAGFTINTIDDDYKGLKKLLLEKFYGEGDRESDTEGDSDYKGDLQVNYETVYGVGERTSNTVGGDYKGTALIHRELVIGHGDKDADNSDGNERTNFSDTTYPVTPTDVNVNNGETIQVDVDGTQTDVQVALITVDGTTGLPDGNGVPSGVPNDYKGSAQIIYDAVVRSTDITGTGITEYLEPFDIDDPNKLLTCATDTCTPVDNAFWVTFTEDGDNDSIFNNAPDGDANIKTTAETQRGLSFSIEYDNTVTPGIEYATTNIVIDAGDEWNSGEEIGITLTDSDANTNSLTEETLEVTDPSRIIPTIRIGNPFTLAETDKVELETVDTSADATEGDTITRTIDATVTDISDILVMDNARYTGNSTLTIELGSWDDVNDYLPQNTNSFKGTHMLNYDISDLADATSITLMVGDDDYSLVDVSKDGTSGTKVLTTPSFNATATDPDDSEKTFGPLYDDETGGIIESDEAASLVIELVPDIPADAQNNAAAQGTIIADDAIVIDVFSFGLEDATDDVNNAIYRLELEEDGDNSSDFVGTLEYVGLNQINIWEVSTYEGIAAIDDNIILISDNDSISVEYRDLDANGVKKTFTAGADTPTHSASIALDSDGYKVSDTVTVTVEDADLNVDSGKADIYTTYGDQISSANAVMELLSVSIDNNPWEAGCDGMGGLEATQFTLRETGSDSGVFAGTFAIPAEYCYDGEATTVTGADISAEYVDFRDDSGSLITISASAGIRSLTGSVSLDRTVFPVPFGGEGETSFGTHGDDPLPQGDLTVYVSINDSDFDQSANGIDSIEVEGVAPLTVTVIRGSDDIEIATAGNTGNAIDETARDSGIFEYELTLSYDMGPDSSKCPVGMGGCILQGDILHVEYNDPSDASGSSNTVTDSATFDLRNGVLQSDQTAYIIGSGMIVTLIEPDLNLDSGSVETYDLDLIEWDSDAGTETLADSVFDATPSNLLETGEDTGIFQVVVSIPNEIDGDRLERGEEITLTYLDWGPSGSDFVGDKDEEITTTVYTSNFGATIELDQRVYTWTDKVYVTIVAPDHNIDSDQVDEIGNNDDYPIRVSTRGNEIDEYKLVETGADTGIFSGEITLIGFEHDADGDGNDDAGGQTSPDRSGPTDGRIGTESESGISVSFKYSEGETVSSSALIRWNVGEVQWLEASYPASGSGIVRVIDPDMNLNPEAVDNFDVTVWSDSDGGGIDLTVTETNAATGIFEGTVFFGVGVDTSGHRLRVVEGDTVTAQYYDNTLPAPFKETERVRVGATTLIGTIVPPLERVPISDLRAVDSFGSTLDTISVDSQIQLAADLTNGQDKSQDFAYLIQIQDGNGVTVSLNWITGSLSASQSLSPATSWTPTEAGTYEVTAFAWESIENPTALSPTSTITITVN